MNIISILTAILMLTAGIGVFLVACKALSTNLENASSQKLKELFAKTGKNKWLGVGIGTLGTAAIQSSGAVTVMVIGFVNVGIMTLAQAATIIYGANIGTTITAQIVALGMFGGNGISASVIFSAFAGIGVFISMGARHERWKQIGGILTGFGLLFVGLFIMSNAMDDFASLDSVRNFLATISNPILLVLIGTLLTALIQSSSVLTSIAITMVFSGLISLDQGIYMTMGSNIGSCVVAILAGMSSGTNAKRTALIHLFFNVMGVVLFLFIALLLHIFSGGSASFGTVINNAFPYAPQLQLALFHTIFNVCTTLVALPMTNLLVNTVTRLIPEKVETQQANKPHLYYLDESMLRTPVLAVRQVKSEIENMAELAMENFRRSIVIVTTLEFNDLVNFQNAKLSNKPLNKTDNKYLNTAIKSVSDLERIGDYAENIVEYAETLKAQRNTFSEPAIMEIKEMKQLIETLYGHILKAYSETSIEELENANKVEEQIDRFTETMEDRHIERLVSGQCTAQVGAEYISLAQNAERIADHLINVGKSIRKFA